MVLTVFGLLGLAFGRAPRAEGGDLPRKPLLPLKFAAETLTCQVGLASPLSVMMATVRVKPATMGERRGCR
jgi:hypothetical protein